MEENGTSTRLANQLYEAGINYSREITARRVEQLSKRAKVFMLIGFGLVIWSFIQEDGAYLFYILASIVIIFGLKDFRDAGRVTFNQALSVMT